MLNKRNSGTSTKKVSLSPSDYPEGQICKTSSYFSFSLKYSLLPQLCFICILVEQLFSILVSELNTPREISLHSKYLPSLHSVSPPFFSNKAELNPILHTWFGGNCFTCDGSSSIPFFLSLLVSLGGLPVVGDGGRLVDITFYTVLVL